MREGRFACDCGGPLTQNRFYSLYSFHFAVEGNAARVHRILLRGDYGNCRVHFKKDERMVDEEKRNRSFGSLDSEQIQKP